MTRPLRSTPITGASPLLRVGPPAEPATVLTPTQSAGYSLSPTRETRTSSVGFGLLPFHAEAADRARVASMPDTAWPISGHPPDSSRDHLDTPVSMSPTSFSTRQQRIACARLPDPRLTHDLRRFHIAHHGRVTTPAACRGLKPPPAGRLRRADNPSSPAQHHFTKLYLHRTPFHVRDTPRRWSGSRGESHPPAPTDPYVNLAVHTALVILITRRRERLWSRSSARRTAGTLR